MSTAIRLIVLLVLLFFVLTAVLSQALDDPHLSREEREKAIREQESRWNLQPERVRTRERAPRESSAIDSRTERFTVIPGQTSELVLASGTKLTIPPHSFQGSEQMDRISAEIIELRTPSDFAFAGISTESTENGKPVLLESAGMVRLRFLWNTTEVLLAQSAGLKLEMQPAAYGDFNVYRREDSGSWKLRGKPVENRAVPECKQVECPTLSTLAFDKIDRGGWWNFDEPKPEFTCITGTVEGGDSAAIRGMGLYRNWVSHANELPGKKGKFAMNIMRNEQTKVVGLIERKDRAWIASFPAFQSQAAVTHTKLQETKNYSRCQNIGSAKFQEVPLSALRDKNKFLNAIGWEGPK